MIVEQFIKKPVAVQAVHWDGDRDEADEIVDWITSSGGDALSRFRPHTKIPLTIEIRTLEGTMIATPGDWIICGIRGEFYPCKPDIFDEIYLRG